MELHCMTAQGNRAAVSMMEGEGMCQGRLSEGNIRECWEGEGTHRSRWHLCQAQPPHRDHPLGIFHAVPSVHHTTVAGS